MLTIDQRHAWTILTSLANPLKVAVKEVVTTNLKALLDHLGRILVDAIVGCESKDVVNGPATVGRSTMFANMLDAPIAELAMGDDIDASQNLVDTGALILVSCCWL